MLFAQLLRIAAFKSSGSPEVREIAEGLTKDPSQGVDPAVGQLVGDYYASCMDEAALEKTLPALAATYNSDDLPALSS